MTMRAAEIGVGATASRAAAIRRAGSLRAALEAGALPQFVDVSVAEGVVLGLLNQGVSKYLVVFGHGSTSLGEVLRIYEEAGAVRAYAFHNEVAMAHAATALRWQYGEVSAVVASIGPGPLQALAGSLTAISNGVGVYHIYGDETTHGEGYNFQQIPKPGEQHSFSRMTAIAGESYLLHTPEALRDMLRHGAARVFHPYRAGPFYAHLPMNIQPAAIKGLNLLALPQATQAKLGPASDDDVAAAAALVRRYKRIVIKAGGGARQHGAEIRTLAEQIGAVVATSPVSGGLLPEEHPHSVHVAGTKGSISGNFATENADLVIVAGSRAVCQADCSGIGYKTAKAVINLNADWNDANHYNETVALVGDIGASARALVSALRDAPVRNDADRQAWLSACLGRKRDWRAYRDENFAKPALYDPVWQRPVRTQPVVLKTIVDFAKTIGAVKYFDSGDVQSNALQICEDDTVGETYTDGGASYMGFAVSALVASAIADHPTYGIAVSGDGAFWMNPQILLDGIEHGVRGMIVILDNRRMGAISTLQSLQFSQVYKTSDGVSVDYGALGRAVQGVGTFFGGFTRESVAAALKQAYAYEGLSLVHVPVFWSQDGQGNLGAYGEWNVGNWCAAVQDAYRTQTI